MFSQFLRHLDHIHPHRTFLEKLDIALKVAQAKIEDMQYEIANTHYHLMKRNFKVILT